MLVNQKLDSNEEKRDKLGIVNSDRIKEISQRRMDDVKFYVEYNRLMEVF